LEKERTLKMINIEELTIGQLREITAMLGNKQNQEHHYPIGKNVFIRTVTHHHTGKLIAVTSQELVLENAAWIADDGKFSTSLAKCEFAEVEMFPANSRVIVGRGGIIDCVEIATIPTSSK
jgi:hypothetical protein